MKNNGKDGQIVDGEQADGQEQGAPEIQGVIALATIVLDPKMGTARLLFSPSVKDKVRLATLINKMVGDYLLEEAEAHDELMAAASKVLRPPSGILDPGQLL